MEEKKESVNVSPDPSEQRAPLSPSADEAQAASAGSAPMDPAKCGAHEIHCIEQEAELAEARVRERVRTEAAEAERALDNAAHCASAEQKSVLSEEQPDKAQNTRLPKMVSSSVSQRVLTNLLSNRFRLRTTRMQQQRRSTKTQRRLRQPMRRQRIRRTSLTLNT